MAEDYYKTLGIAKTATQDEIQKAYLTMARKYHPDKNLDDQEGAKKKFQELQQAFDTLKDPEKRKKYDQFGANFEQYGGASGFPPGGGFGGFGGGSWQGTSGSDFGGNINIEDILGMFAGQGRNPFETSPNRGGAGTKRSRKTVPLQGENISSSIEIPLATAVRGGKTTISFNDGTGKIRSVDVNIPSGIEERKTIRLRGLGQPSTNGGEHGDLVLEIRTIPHPYFSRKGNDLYVRVPLTLKEAALGAKIDVPIPRGTISVTVPPGSTTGTQLRVKGQGIPPLEKEGKIEREAGNLFLKFEVQLPSSWSKEDQMLLSKIDSSVSPVIRSELQF